jgi:putative transposase
MVKPAAYRLAVGFVASEFEMSKRRACRALGVARSSFRYRSRRPVPTELVERLRSLAARRPRWGYRRLQVILRREGVRVNHKRVYRLYRAEGLAVRRKRRKRMAAAIRTAPPPPAMPHRRWSMDFTEDWLAVGRRFRTLNVVDDFTRTCAAIEVDTSLLGTRVSRVLDRVIAGNRKRAGEGARRLFAVVEGAQGLVKAGLSHERFAVVTPLMRSRSREQ